MRKLIAVHATEGEQKRIDDGIAAIRDVLDRFGTENQDRIAYAPIVLIQITPNQKAKVYYRLSAVGYPTASGETLDAAFDNLSGKTDPSTKRTEAEEFRRRANELEKEADIMEREEAALTKTDEKFKREDAETREDDAKCGNVTCRFFDARMAMNCDRPVSRTDDRPYAIICEGFKEAPGNDAAPKTDTTYPEGNEQ